MVNDTYVESLCSIYVVVCASIITFRVQHSAKSLHLSLGLRFLSVLKTYIQKGFGEVATTVCGHCE